MGSEDKLDWIYKGANSLVDREDYLLGRKVDRTLEQLNEEEKPNKIVLPTPKNHVEHECIPPSIRDFNKIVQAEQVDLTAKLQEDPLVAIKKREEEARRQFLQNPIQIKKLQEALKKKEDLKKKHKKRKKKDLDERIKEKLQNLKAGSLGLETSKKGGKKEKEDVLNTILMHKFNALKDKLSEDDLQDILNGRISSESSDDEAPKKKKAKDNESSDSDSGDEDRRRKNKKDKLPRSRSKSVDRGYFKERRGYYDKTGSQYKDYSSRTRDRDFPSRKREEHHKRVSRSRSNSRGRSKAHLSPRREKEHYRSHSSTKKSKTREDHKYKKLSSSAEGEKKVTRKQKQSHRSGSDQSSDASSDSELDKKIMARLKILRTETETKAKENKDETKRVMLPAKPSHLNPSKSNKVTSSSSDSSSEEDSDSGDETPKVKKNFGLVNSEGKKLALSSKTPVRSTVKVTKNVAEPVLPQRKNIKKLTEEEKEKLRKEMIKDAKVRDKEREASVKKYREKDKCEEETVTKKFDADAVHAELLKSAKVTSVEQRIRSNLNNIQRSSRHMDQNFSKR